MQEPALAAWLGERFTHVLVDEYQDTNRLQAAILLGLKPQGRGLTVVGDDAQAIYAFRAAEVRNILDFPGHFSPPASVLNEALAPVDRDVFRRQLQYDAQIQARTAPPAAPAARP